MILRDLEFDSDKAVAGLTCDSREVKPGYVFAALPGTVTDGRKYIENALEKGASAILSTKGLDLPVPYIGSDEPRLDYAKMAAALFAGQPEVLVAMTGTNGKSSTVDFLRQIWATNGVRGASMGTLGAIGPDGAIDVGHTTPDPVTVHKTLSDLAGNHVTHLAMEASSHGLAQYRMDGVKLAAVVGHG